MLQHFLQRLGSHLHITEKHHLVDVGAGEFEQYFGLGYGPLSALRGAKNDNGSNRWFQGNLSESGCQGEWVSGTKYRIIQFLIFDNPPFRL